MLFVFFFVSVVCVDIGVFVWMEWVCVCDGVDVDVWVEELCEGEEFGEFLELVDVMWLMLVEGGFLVIVDIVVVSE